MAAAGDRDHPARKINASDDGARIRQERAAIARPRAEIQHPATRPHLGQRLGPTAVIVPETAIEALRRGLNDLGLELREFLATEEER